MKRLRKIIFWCHLSAGTFAGVIILIMSVTGVLLTFQRQITAWADTRGYSVAPPAAGASRLPLESIVAKGQSARGTPPTSIALRADATAPVMLSFGRDDVLFVDPYTGDVLGEGSRRTRAFFQFVTEWHRWLGAQGDGRSIGRAVTGACNLAFLFLVMSGFYLWFPRNWTRKQVRSVAWFKRGLTGRARNFNWHNVVGLWCVLPLFIVVISAVVISYTWATNLVYRAVGEPPPAPRTAPNPPTSGASQTSGREQGEAKPSLDGIDALLLRSERQVADWRSISFQLPTKRDAPVTFTIDRGDGGQPQKRAQLTLDRSTGDVVRWEPFASYTPGRRLRSYLRFAHTGEVLGVVGQAVAGVASLGGALLVYTGLALAFRRLRGWIAARLDTTNPRSRSEVEVLSESGGD